MMRTSTLLYAFLFATLCLDVNAQYFVFISKGCEFYLTIDGNIGAQTIVDGLNSTKGECADISVAINDSTLIGGLVASKKSVKLVSLPLNSVSVVNEIWRRFDGQFTEIDHSLVLGPHCSYEAESFSLFIDMNVLYTVAECRFPSNANAVGALTRSLIRSDQIVNTPPGPLIYFKLSSQPQIAGASGNRQTDAGIVRYRLNGKKVECVFSSLHQINQTAAKTLDLGNIAEVAAVTAFNYAQDVTDTQFTVYRLELAGGQRMFRLYEKPPCGSGPIKMSLKSPALAFVARFAKNATFGNFQQQTPYLKFVVGRKYADWWTAEYERLTGPPRTCPANVWKAAMIDSAERINQKATLNLLYAAIAAIILFPITLVVALAGVLFLNYRWRKQANESKGPPMPMTPFPSPTPNPTVNSPAGEILTPSLMKWASK